ncbi:hypothetical protein GCM10018962_14050 [Dactylosporangium matsuzakiense]|uniref:Uncharacterized protein n=1 Tax=Dactylosporangium matsuzakiense TaxID=53360 RepID=A0A9W6NR27_9ACTN|nr:hypothetical protein GCM10017581_077160 [Dactylosporangium matsuzakiense]
MGEEFSDGVADGDPVRSGTVIQGIKDVLHRAGISVRRGHKRTIRPGPGGSQHSPGFADPFGQGIVCCGAPCKASLARMLDHRQTCSAAKLG